MLPLRDDNPTSRTPVVVVALLALNISVFLLVQPQGLIGSSESLRVEQTIFLACRASIPREVISRQPLADIPPARLDRTGRILGEVQRSSCPDKSVWFAVLLSLFLHGGTLHLGFNMLFLWVFGNNVEDRLGRMRFLAFYLASGVAATLIQSLLSADSSAPLIGASGAIAGVLGAYLLMFPRARVRTLIIMILITVIDLPAAVVLGLWFFLQLLQGYGPGAVESNVAYAAHIGGFVTGMVLAIPWARPRRLRSRHA